MPLDNIARLLQLSRACTRELVCCIDLIWIAQQSLSVMRSYLKRYGFNQLELDCIVFKDVRLILDMQSAHMLYKNKYLTTLITARYMEGQ